MTPLDWHAHWTQCSAQGLSNDVEQLQGMKRTISIFFTLEYWQDLKIAHLLDPMHIFKNVGELLWKHLTGEKDTLSARADLEVANQKSALWPRIV